MFKSLNMYSISLLFTVLAFNTYAGNVDYSQIEKNFKRYEQKVHALKQSIDNSVFNDEEILLKLDFDTGNLIAFMQDKIVFQPYVGLLRGVQGTLNSRAGNALDQSVLLAKLLNDAGLETRIANGTLTDNQAMLLLSSLSNATLPQHIGKGSDFEKAIAAISSGTSDNSQKPLNWQNSETNKRYKSTIKILQSTLKNNNILLISNNITKKLMVDSKNYFWVEYRMGISDKWSSAHPVFKVNSNIDVKATSYFKDDVPEKYLHQVRIEAFIQQRLKSNYKTHSLMKPWQKPLANLQNVLLTYSNAPSGVSIRSDFDLNTIVNKTTFFSPTFNGRAVGGKVFDLKGRLIDSEAMNSQAGGLFQTLGDKTLMAMDAVDGKAKGESSMQLMAQWLKFTFISPNGDEFVQKRYIYQATKEKDIDEKQVKFKLLTEYALLANSGEKPMAYLSKVYLDLVESGLPLLKASTRKMFSGEEKTAFPKDLPSNEFELLTQYYWMNNNPNLDKAVVHYRETGNMLGFKRGYVNADTAFLAVDIINNKQKFIQKKQDKYFNAPQAAFSQGIWETASEWLPSRLMGLKGVDIDTLKVTNAAIKQGVKLQVIKSKTEETRQIFKNNDVALQRLQADLDLGYWAVIPAHRPDDLSMTGWWRINPETGETLGMTADGGGQEATEYMIDLTAQALSLIRALGNLKKCADDNSLNNFEKMCCYAEAHLNNVGGMAFGGALGKAVGTAGAAVFDIVDFTTELATGSGIAPGTNGAICKAVGPLPDF